MIAAMTAKDLVEQRELDMAMSVQDMELATLLFTIEHFNGDLDATQKFVQKTGSVPPIWRRLASRLRDPKMRGAVIALLQREVI